MRVKAVCQPILLLELISDLLDSGKFLFPCFQLSTGIYKEILGFVDMGLRHAHH